MSYLNIYSNPPKMTSSLDPSQDINPSGVVVDGIVRLLSWQRDILGLEEHLVAEEVGYLVGLWIKRVGD